MSDDKCNDCKYWKQNYVKRKPHGECRYNPPVVIVNDTNATVFPRTNADDWCGRFKARDIQEG